MTELNRQQELAQTAGAARMGSMISAAIGYIITNYERIQNAKKGLEDSDAVAIQWILDAGLNELEAFADECRAEEERERSEKDCLWEGRE